MVLAVSEEPHKRFNGTVFTPIFEVIERAAVKAFITGGANELLGDTIYRLSRSEDFTQALVGQLITSSTFTAPVACFVRKQPEKFVAGEAKD